MIHTLVIQWGEAKQAQFKGIDFNTHPWTSFWWSQLAKSHDLLAVGGELGWSVRNEFKVDREYEEWDIEMTYSNDIWEWRDESGDSIRSWERESEFVWL